MHPFRHAPCTEHCSYSWWSHHHTTMPTLFIFFRSVPCRAVPYRTYTIIISCNVNLIYEYDILKYSLIPFGVLWTLFPSRMIAIVFRTTTYLNAFKCVPSHTHRAGSAVSIHTPKETQRHAFRKSQTIALLSEWGGGHPGWGRAEDNRHSREYLRCTAVLLCHASPSAC